MPISLKQMRYAMAVADLGHFGRAAERSHVSQPALSQQILLLEEECGTRLFDRLGKSIRLTPFGREFIERARTIIGGADELEAFAAGHTGLPMRPLRFGLIPTVAPYLLPEIFPALKQDLPDLSFTISESRTDALLKGLAEANLDLALIASGPPPGGARLTVAPLFMDGFVLATSTSENPAEPVGLSSIDPDRILLLDEGHCFREQAIAACGLDGDPAAKTFAATSLSTIVEFVANGQGVTLLPEISLRKEATDPRIRIHSLAAPGAGRMLSLVWREATPFTAIFETITRTIRAAHSNAEEARSA
jgi:LysR family hydrogen peroxide-inducible transcriptional activator